MQRGDSALEARSQKSDHYLIDIAASLKIGCQPTFDSAVLRMTLICKNKSPPACSRKFFLCFCTHVQGSKTGKADSLACVKVLKESRSLDSTNMQRGDDALEARSQKSDHYLIDIASSLTIGCQPTFDLAVFQSLPSSHLCLCFSPVTVISKDDSDM